MTVCHRFLRYREMKMETGPMEMKTVGDLVSLPQRQTMRTGTEMKIEYLHCIADLGVVLLLPVQQ
jgi:hypothetical protein